MSASLPDLAEASLVAPTGDSGADLGRAAIAGVAFGDAGADETAAESGAGFTDSAGVGFCTAGAGVAAGLLTTGLGLGIGFVILRMLFLSPIIQLCYHLLTQSKPPRGKN